MTKNNQSKNLIDSSKVFILGLQMQTRTQFRASDANLKTKNRSMTQTLQLPYNTNLEPLGLCNSDEYKTVFLHFLWLEK